MSPFQEAIALHLSGCHSPNFLQQRPKIRVPLEGNYSHFPNHGRDTRPVKSSESPLGNLAVTTPYPKYLNSMEANGFVVNPPATELRSG